MSYVTEDYYKDTYHGEPLEDRDFPGLLMRAEEIVEELYMYRINPENINAYSSSVQERIKKAVCAQIEYLNANGGSDMDNGVDLQSGSLGKFSYTVAASSTGNTEKSVYAPRAQRLLAPKGLLYRGGEVT